VRVVSNRHLGFLSSDSLEGGAVLQDFSKLDVLRNVDVAKTNGSGPLTDAEREQIAREVAAIEQASAALRRGDPELQSWVNVPTPMMQKPRPVWLLIGVLWLSTALVAIGAAFAISALVG
jgi:hypothetical protein